MIGRQQPRSAAKQRSGLGRKLRRAQTAPCAALPAKATAGPSPASVLSIIPYAITNGIQFAKIKPVVFDGSSQRGIMATFDINNNECMCSVPAKASLRTFPGCQPVLGLPGPLWQQLPWSAQLALILLFELKQGASSKYADYIAVLPSEVDVPALWSEEELQQLKCLYFIQQVQQQQQEWAALDQKLKHYLAAAGITTQQLKWALSITRSRAFAAPYASAPLSTAPKVLLAAQVAAAGAWLVQGAGAAAAVEVLAAAAAAGLGFWLVQQSKTQQQHAMCPLLDLFNHNGMQQSECELDVWSDVFRVVSSSSWPQGQQVFISYGSSSSDVLLQLYGFVEQNNVHERYLVRCLPDVLSEQGLLQARDQSSMQQTLAEVAFTRQGISASLEQLCSSRQQVNQGTDSSAGSVPYAALSSSARAVCAHAVQTELQQLGVNQQGDQQVLQAYNQLPSKQDELSALQQQVPTRLQELQRLQQQLAEAEELLEQQKHKHEHQPEHGGQLVPEQQGQMDAESAETGSEGAIAAKGQLQQLQLLIDEKGEELQQLQAQTAELEQLVADWQGRIAADKRLAVQFRLEKAQLLDDALCQLQ